MKLNGFIYTGVTCVVLGWLWLAFGSSIDTGRFNLPMDRVFNMHLASMAQQLAMLGYTLTVCGTIVSGFRWLKPERPVVSSTNGLADRIDETNNPIDLSDLPTGKSMAQKREEALRSINHNRHRSS